MQDLLRIIYGDCAGAIAQRVDRLLAAHEGAAHRHCGALWDERDVVLITYADQVREPGTPPLRTLHDWLVGQELDRLFSTIHLLPFFPWSSDDGFSVIDYRAVDPAYGDWDDVERLSERFDLMFDLVLNHCSSKSAWFESYRSGQAPYDRFFVESDPTADLSAVVRPRSLPLLTPVETASGTRLVWTTFSADQIDLDFSNPDVLLEMLDILLGYARRGARIIRLDAIAYLWKEIGTPCVNLPQTHAMVRLIRQVLDRCYPGTLVLTETNLPHDENVSYFGDGDEAHLVYQFSLPPLLLDAYQNRDATVVSRWLDGVEAGRGDTAFFNFLASHDGIGMRPFEGLVDDKRQADVIEAVRSNGGRVSTRTASDGTERPYELNITWFAAQGGQGIEQQVARFLGSHALLLALRGIPALYFHSLIGSPNMRLDDDAPPRSINRQRHSLDELQAQLATTHSGKVLRRMAQMLSTRVAQPAFHPNAGQRIVPTGNAAVLAFERCSAEPPSRILVVVNFSDQPQWLDIGHAFDAGDSLSDLLSGTVANITAPIRVAPFQVMWLSAPVQRAEAGEGR